MAQSVRVAVVEDDALVRSALSRLLSAVGFEVSQHASAEEFLLRLDRARPTCVLADVHLPRLSGLELETVLNELGCHLPFVFITGDRDVAASDSVRQAGVTCLLKPVEDAVLLTAVIKASGSAPA